MEIEKIIKLLISEDLKKIDKTIRIGSKPFKVTAYRVGVRLFRIDVKDEED